MVKNLLRTDRLGRFNRAAGEFFQNRLKADGGRADRLNALAVMESGEAPIVPDVEPQASTLR